jgi:hypothetical protein
MCYIKKFDSYGVSSFAVLFCQRQPRPLTVKIARDFDSAPDNRSGYSSLVNICMYVLMYICTTYMSLYAAAVC